MSELNSERMEQIQAKLEASLNAEDVHLTDDSHLHAGHAGAKSGAGHFTVTVVSTAFKDKTSVQRHRLIYEALGDMMGPDIHALSIKAFTPDEI